MIDSNEMTYSSIGSAFTQASLAVTVQKKNNHTKNKIKQVFCFRHTSQTCLEPALSGS